MEAKPIDHIKNTCLHVKNKNRASISCDLKGRIFEVRTALQEMFEFSKIHPIKDILFREEQKSRTSNYFLKFRLRLKNIHFSFKVSQKPIRGPIESKLAEKTKPTLFQIEAENRTCISSSSVAKKLFKPKSLLNASNLLATVKDPNLTFYRLLFPLI